MGLSKDLPGEASLLKRYIKIKFGWHFASRLHKKTWVSTIYWSDLSIYLY